MICIPHNNRFKYPVSAPVKIKKVKPPSEQELESQLSFKYSSYNFALQNSTEGVRKIINSVRLSGEYKYTVVDVKVVSLKKGEFPCLPGWHTDCTLDPHHKTKPETHHIYIYGADCRTRFLADPLSIDLSNKNLKKEICTSVEKQELKEISIEEGYIYRYNRFSIHAPSQAGKSGTRLLVRVTETDLIRPVR